MRLVRGAGVPGRPGGRLLFLWVVILSKLLFGRELARLVRLGYIMIMQLHSTHASGSDESGSGVRPFFQLEGFEDQEDIVLLVECREVDGAWIPLSGSVQPTISEAGFLTKFLAFMPTTPTGQVEFRATVADSASFVPISGGRIPIRRILGQDPLLLKLRGPSNSSVPGSAPVVGGGLDISALAHLIQQTVQATVAPIAARLEASELEARSLRERLLDEKRDERLSKASVEEQRDARSADLQNNVITTMLAAQQAIETQRMEADMRRRQEEEDARRRNREYEEELRRRRMDEAEEERKRQAEERRQAREDAAAAHKLELEAARQNAALEIEKIQARAQADQARAEAALTAERARLDLLATQERERADRLASEDRLRLEARRLEDKELLLKEQAMQEQHFALQLKMLETLNPKGQSDVERMMEGVTTVIPGLLSQFGLETADLKDFAKDMVKRVLGGGGGDGEEGGGGSPILESVIEHIGPVAVQAFERYMNRTAPTAPAPPQQIPAQVPVPRPPMWTPNPVPAPPVPFDPPPMLPNNLPPQTVPPVDQPEVVPVQTSVPGLSVAQVSSARQVAAQIGAAVQMSPRDQWSAKIGALLTGEFNAYIQEMGANDALITYGEIPHGYYPTVKQEVEALVGVSLKD